MQDRPNTPGIAHRSPRGIDLQRALKNDFSCDEIPATSAFQMSPLIGMLQGGCLERGLFVFHIGDAPEQFKSPYV